MVRRSILLLVVVSSVVAAMMPAMASGPGGFGVLGECSEGCGAPLVVDECKSSGWEAFTYPRTFSDQGDCVA